MRNMAISELVDSAARAVRLIGYPRSGQHAISHWLFSQMPGQNLWLNNIQGTRFDKVYYYNGKVDVKTDEPIFLIGLGYEGPPVREEFSELPTILVRRDLRNHVASLLAHKHIDLGDDFWQCWRDYHDMAITLNEVVVNFPNWHEGYMYRMALFDRIGYMNEFHVTFSDRGKETILGSGGGSSFDGRSEITRPRFGAVALSDIPQRFDGPAYRDLHRIALIAA